MPELTLLERLGAGNSLELAPVLLGCVLVSEVDEATVRLRITEVEAYGGADDPASHSYRGPTPRNQSMFLVGGHLYVYRIYGIHWCANVVTGPAGSGQAILLRSGVVTAGAEVAVARRGRADRLATGPGNLAEALAISGAHDGVWLGAGQIRLEPGAETPQYVSTPRVGVSKATDRLWRLVETRAGRSSST